MDQNQLQIPEKLARIRRLPKNIYEGSLDQTANHRRICCLIQFDLKCALLHETLGYNNLYLNISGCYAMHARFMRLIIVLISRTPSRSTLIYWQNTASWMNSSFSYAARTSRQTFLNSSFSIGPIQRILRDLRNPFVLFCTSVVTLFLRAVRKHCRFASLIVIYFSPDE